MARVARKTTAKAKPKSKKESGTGRGTEVADAIAARDGEAALEAALAWWRDARAPELANLVDAISARVSPPPIEDEVTWGEVASRKRACELGALLPEVPSLPASYLPTAAHLLALFADDPRITGAFATWALEPPTTSSSTHPFWTTMFDIVNRTRDARVRANLEKRRRMAPGASKFWPRFYGAIDKAVAKLRALPPVELDAATRATIAKLATATAKLGQVAADAEPRVTPMPDRAAPRASGSSLAQASEHLAAAARPDGTFDVGRVVAAIDAMLERWRAVRSPGLADLIDVATTLLPSYDRPLAPDATPKAAQGAWEAAMAEPGANLPLLVDNVIRHGVKLAEARLVDLANLPDDPRIASRLAARSAMFNSVSRDRMGYWKPLFGLIARTRDVRTVAPLATSGRYYAKLLAPLYAVVNDVDPANASTWPRLVGDDAKHAQAIQKTLATALAADRARLLPAAIAADFDDPGPRQVYADWLLERDHPRGEVVALGEKVHAGTASAAELARYRERLGAWSPGAFDDLDSASRYHEGNAPEERMHRGLPRHVSVGQYPNTLTWHRVLEHPLLPVIGSITFRETMMCPIDPQAIANVMLGARHLTRVTIDRATHPTLASQLTPLVERGYYQDQIDASFARKSR